MIPVIDLKGGAGRARANGRTRAYRPIETPLSPTSDPVDVVRGLLAIYPFPTLYVADLDAIQRTRRQFRRAARISRAEFPQLTLWVDNGARTSARSMAVGSGIGAPVIGSESQRDSALIAGSAHSAGRLLARFPRRRVSGAPEMLAEPELWPRQMIVMTLAASAAAPVPISPGSLRSADCGRPRNLRRRRRARRRRSRRAQRRGRWPARWSRPPCTKGGSRRPTWRRSDPSPCGDQLFLPSGPNCLR